jgi:heterodisulfide reductase subunit A-like polyferredoxin
MNVGAFVCSCADTCAIDLEGVREGVEDVDLVASSNLLCEDGLPAMDQLVEEYDLDQLIVTTPEPRCQEKFEDLAAEKGLHPEATAFVDQREGAGWVHEERAATEKTARLINTTYTGLEHEASARSVSREAGRSVAVVGDSEVAAALADTAEVTLIANGEEYAGSDADLEEVTVERGRVESVEGKYGEFEVALEAGVTTDCVSCMKCVERGPDEAVTSYPVDIEPGTEDGPWTECPTDAIVLEGTHRTLAFDQVIRPGAPSRARGGQLGYYTNAGPGTIAAVESLLGGATKPEFLDFDMEVCAAGESSQEGCTACVEACPHEAVDRPRIDEVEFDEISCQNCGACTSSCPTGAVTLREPSNERLAREVETLLEEPDTGGFFSRSAPAISPQVIAFVCSEHAARRLREYGRRAAGRDGREYHPILPVRVNCTDTVGEAHLTHALAAGADGAAIVGCGEQCLHSGPDPKAELVDRLNTATSDLGLGERVSFLSPGGSSEGFAEELDGFVAGLEESPVPVGHTATGESSADRDGPPFNSQEWTLESLRVILEHAEPTREVIRGLKDFGRMEVSEACALTPTCSNLCPTDAIRREDGDLEFNHERCVNCGLCAEGCPESAITMQAGLDLSLLPENRDVTREVAAGTDENEDEESEADDPAWTTVLEGEMRECTRCGTPFASERTAEKIEGEVGDLVSGVAPDAEDDIFAYCGDCRAAVLFESGEVGAGGSNAGGR